MKKKYKIQVTRRYYTCITVNVEADNAEQAKELAEIESGSIEGSMQYEDTDDPYILEGDEDEKTFKVVFYDENDEVIDTTEIDENNEDLAWELFKEFGHERLIGTYVEITPN